MNIRFQQHLLEVQTKELVKYVDSLENNNEVMMKFIQDKGLGEQFEQMIAPKEELASPIEQTSNPVVQGGDTIANHN